MKHVFLYYRLFILELAILVIEPISIIYCILHGRIKGFNSSIMCQVGSYRTVVG